MTPQDAKDLMTTTQIWSPNLSHSSQMQEFIGFVNYRHSLQLQDYPALHEWSIKHIDDFWLDLSDFYQVYFHQAPQFGFKPGIQLWQAEWFGGARLNYAENILSRGQEGLAIVAIHEDGHQTSIDFTTLRQQVAATAAMLQSHQIKAGDRVVGITTNEIPAIIAFLACASIGAIWANCSPDFGDMAIIERFSQLSPKLLFAVHSHQYQGKTYQHEDKIEKLLTASPSIQTVVWLDKPGTSKVENLSFSSFIHEQHPPIYTPLPFDHPLFVLFSSGTTGKPKCILHRAGGVLLEHFKDLGLHTDLRQEEKLLFYTTTGWMMWNWIISALGLGTTLLLYEGSPAYPKTGRLMEVLAETKASVFGASAAYFASLEKAQYQPTNISLNEVRTVLSTGSTLLCSQYDYLQTLFGHHLQISSISGGTDIVSCFALGNPCLPVYRGELQCLGLGMDVQIFNSEGQAVLNEEGELVCTQAFPTIPLGFWGDNPQQERFQQTYFAKFPGVWAHGDFAKRTEHQGLIIYGRSDATLNPQGVRFGSAELYAVVNKVPGITESIAVSQAYDGDTRVLLFIVLEPSLTLDEPLTQKIRQAIRQQLSPRHLPAKIIQVSGVPKTLNGKLMETLVQQLVAGKPVSNPSVVSNPDCLADYQNPAILR